MVGYEEGDKGVIGKMKTGYPRSAGLTYLSSIIMIDEQIPHS